MASEWPETVIEVRALDLAALASVRAFAGEVLESHTKIDLPCANAGVMVTPPGHGTL